MFDEIRIFRELVLTNRCKGSIINCGPFRRYLKIILFFSERDYVYMKSKYISCLANGALAGIMLCIGCAVNLSSENPILGAFLFSLGLFAIIKLNFGLYTGKAGYMAVNPPSYIGEVALALAGNICGAAIGGAMLGLTRFSNGFADSAAVILSVKFADSYLSTFFLSMFCGILMFTAVEGNKRAMAAGDGTGALFAVSVPVMVFIICGFNHCIADICYFFISGCVDIAAAVPYFIFVILGNAAGCMLIPFVKRFAAREM